MVGSCFHRMLGCCSLVNTLGGDAGADLWMHLRPLYVALQGSGLVFAMLHDCTWSSGFTGAAVVALMRSWVSRAIQMNWLTLGTVGHINDLP